MIHGSQMYFCLSMQSAQKLVQSARLMLVCVQRLTIIQTDARHKYTNRHRQSRQTGKRRQQFRHRPGLADCIGRSTRPSQGRRACRMTAGAAGKQTGCRPAWGVALYRARQTSSDLPARSQVPQPILLSAGQLGNLSYLRATLLSGISQESGFMR